MTLPPRATATAVVGALALCLSTPACDKKPEPQPDPSASTRAAPAAAELKIEELRPGTGREAKAGNKVKVHYTGTLTNGEKFDSSHDHGEPFEFTLGAGEVIKGWDEGVAGMKVGGKRKLTVPPKKGYGDAGSPPKIPPRSTLLFEVELLDVVS